MVSTRGIKLKFSENERVLCYEPDPTKAKVLYDSKVLDVVVTKDHRGRKTVEYLIHFQGWNSSWDRYVSEEYVLKDTAENRQLQKDLAEKSQLQLGAYLYRRDRKKHNRKSTTGPSSDEGSSSSPPRMDTDDGHDETTSSEDDSSVDDETIPIELTTELKTCLEQDYYLINTKNKLVKLPAEPNVVNILESYWKHYATSQIYEKTKRYQKRQPEDVQRHEILDGLRIYFDYTVADLLLYKSEQGQVHTRQAVYNSSVNKEESNKNDVMDYITYSNNLSEDDSNSDSNQALQRKRSLRSSKSESVTTNGNSHPETVAKAKSAPSTEASEGPSNLTRTLSFRLLPEHVYSQHPHPPCLVYGAVHLTRLFVKLPELLNASTIEENKWKTVLHHLDSFIEYLNDHREWFGEKFYIDK